MRTSIMTDRFWCAVQTQPQREGFAADQLVRQGFQVFYPRQVRTVRHARRSVQRTVSYFPGYVFVALDLRVHLWRKINGTLGVRSLVMTGDRPSRAPTEFVEALCEACDQDGRIVRQTSWRGGEQVRVLNGPLADQLGTIERLDGLSRVRVLMSLLGAGVPVVTEAGNLALAS